MTSIEIGGGHIVQPGWVNLDPVNGTGDWRRPAQETPWPAADGSVDAIRAAHVMEHIPAGGPRLAVMNEAHRVLRPGGVFEIRVPNCLSGTWHAFADPTHVSFWCVESFHYFDGLFAANADYGIRLWSTLELRVQGDNEILWRGTPR
ncbi:MAG: class I SAM-dependent methyltransferase [Streptomyces sp.]|nr:class I SAM-dependent methyltransferase [Streptomyces sp.]